jgi:hypothetical protein
LLGESGDAATFEGAVLAGLPATDPPNTGLLAADELPAASLAFTVNVY